MQGRIGVEHVHEWNRLALVPAHAEVQCGCCEDGAYSVDHTLENDKEHGCGAGTIRFGEGLNPVSISLKALRLIC